MWSLVDRRQCQIIIIFATGNNYYFYTLELVTSSCIERKRKNCEVIVITYCYIYS